MTAGIWIDPFTINLQTPLAKEHPDWLLNVGGLGKSLVTDEERMLDVTKPEAYAYLRDLFKKIGDDWNFDALVEADFVYRLLFAEGYAKSNLTHVEVFRVGMQAIREGFGEDRYIMSMPPMQINNAFADGIRIGNDCAPVWRKLPDKWPWGCVEAMTNVAHRYYFAPHLWTPDPDCAYFGLPDTKKRWGVQEQPDLTWNQSLAWMTGQALTGGVVKIGDYFPDLNEKQTAVLQKLLPGLPTPARPVDLFDRQDPRIWSFPVEQPVPGSCVVGVFNWNEKDAEKIPLQFGRLGLNPGAQYAVYDFWLDQYYGVATGELAVDTAPGSVHLLCLRPYADRPMFLASDRHVTMGATDIQDLKWDEQARTLSGTINAVENTKYNLRVIVPQGFIPKKAECTPGKMLYLLDGQLLKLELQNKDQGPVKWTIEFTQG
jgi:alpha-galactosidase